MAEIETAGILDEVQSIVSDNLQVVSYKWLSRNFLVPSNVAKRLLQEFVEKHGNGLEVIYSLSGPLKSNPSNYHIRLVSSDKLSDAKQEFDENLSAQVYSVQAGLPKDPATLWNHEFVQAEDLCKQPLSDDNCLRANRFGGVSNPFVKRTAHGSSLGTGTPQANTTGASGASTSFSAHQSTGASKPLQPPESTRNVKTESRVKLEKEQGGQPAVDKEKGPQFPSSNKNGQTDKKSSGTGGGALANMWGRASAKPKPEAALPRANNSKQDSAATAEAQICARESAEYVSSDEDGQDFNIKRSTNGERNRKRRVVIDYSDEEDECQDAVSLALPESPKKLKASSPAFGLECNLFEKENKPQIKEVKKEKDDVKPNQDLRENILGVSSGKKTESQISEKKTLSHVPKNDAGKKDAVANDAGKKDAVANDADKKDIVVNDAAPQRRKVVKTRIDDRGREVTEVVWEGAEPDSKSDSISTKTAENNTSKNPSNRPPVTKKSPAITTAQSNQAGKGGNKKAGTKDPKQGNIMSFFKKA